VNKLQRIIEKDLSTGYIIGESNNILDDDYLFGCEFEFYPKDDSQIESIVTQLSECIKTDLLVHIILF